MARQLYLSADNGAPWIGLLDEKTPAKHGSELGPNAKRPSLGAEDLLWIADLAQRRGFDVEDFEFRTSTFDPLGDDEEQQLSRSLLAMFREGGASAAIEALQSELRNYALIGLGLATPQNDPMIIRRFGYVETTDESAAKDLLDEAWNEIHFS
jgi:hypothetical protein